MRQQSIVVGRADPVWLALNRVDERAVLESIGRFELRRRRNRGGLLAQLHHEPRFEYLQCEAEAVGDDVEPDTVRAGEPMAPDAKRTEVSVTSRMSLSG